MKKTILFCIATLSVFNFFGCTSIPDRALKVAESELETGSDNAILFHSALYYPREISLKFPGLIVGIEKSPKDIISKEGDIEKKEIKGVGPGIKKDINRLGGDSKLMYISHIIENKGLPFGEDNCAIYNAYYRDDNNDIPELIEFCSQCEKIEIKKENAYKSSWKAIDILRDIINNKITENNRLKLPRFSHVLVMTMGWNTEQEEAIRNFNSIVASIDNASGADEFNPLFIGVTWPSSWSSPWLGPIYVGLSYRNKANDADEVGLSWLGVLLDHGLRDIPKEIPIVVIGHSFGARASSMAACVGPAIKENHISVQRKRINKLISLQGAYTIYRHVRTGGDEKSYYPDNCENVDYIALTSSRHDTAMDAGFWSQTAGDDKSYEIIRRSANSKFLCVDVSQKGNINLSSWEKGKILYINADKLIKYNAYKSGGGAHSDIYRNEMGVMLWQIIKK